MPDYSLGRAHGKIEIEYDGSGASKAARDLDKVAESSASADKSLTKTQRTLGDTERQLGSTSTSAQGYQARLRDVESATEGVDSAQRRLNATLLDGKSTAKEIEQAYDDLADARDRHVKSMDSERDAHRALSGEISGVRGIVSSLAGIIPNLENNLGRLRTVTGDAADKSSDLAQTLATAAKVVGLLGPQGKAAAGGLLLASEGIDKMSSSAEASGSVIGGLVKGIAGLEVAVGKVSGITLGLTAIGGLVGTGSAAGLQGIVSMVDAVKQLSGVLGLLPALASGAGVVMGTLAVAFNGVDDALKDMMSDDPTKFLEDIKNMGPAAAQAMLTVAQFRDQFKAAGGAVQDSFFSKIAADLAPLIQTWLPALASAGSQVAGVLGDIAHQFAGLLQQPQVMAAFTTFINNVSAGLQAMAPALAPALDIFSRLTVVGSSFFTQLGGHLMRFMQFFDDIVARAQASGDLQNWIQTGINAFIHLANAAYSFGSAFLNIMTIAEQFGGGGLLGWLEQLGNELNTWTQSTEGKQALTDFFALLRKATDAFMPILPPLLSGLASIGKAFVDLGIATSPAWVTFFQSFASTMAYLGPQIAATAPSIMSFLQNLGATMIRMVETVGPQLPRMFEMMAQSMEQLLPQLPLLANLFLQIVNDVGPMLPTLFASVTDALKQLVPLMPTITGFMRDFVSVLNFLVKLGGAVFETATQIVDGILRIGDVVMGLPETLSKVGGQIEEFFKELPRKAVEWGKNILTGLIDGLKDGVGLSALGGAAKSVVDGIADWFQSSPAKKGPFSGKGYTLVRGRQMITDMAAGMSSAQGAVVDAARSTAAAASGALGTGGAPDAGGADSVGGALLPPWIAGADNSVLSAYLNHQFSETRGLKGFAKDMGAILQVAQSGFNLLSQGVMQNLFTGLGLVPGMNNQRWTKMDPKELAAQQQQAAQRDALQNKDNKPNWQDVLGPGVDPGSNATGPGKPPGPNASQQDVANYIYSSARANGYSDSEAKAFVVQGFGESGLKGGAYGANTGDSSGGASGIFQFTPGTAQDFGLTNPLDAKENIDAYFRLAQARDPHSGDIRSRLAAISGGGPAHPANVGHWDTAVSGSKQFIDALGQDVPPTWGQVTPQAPVPAARPATGGTYGLPGGTDTGGYGTGSGGTFPDWVMALAEQFGIKPSTYAGHQESDRDEAGYAPNPQGLNRGIDWTGPTENLQKFADYLATIPSSLEQVIWENPNTHEKTGIGGGQINPGYYDQGTYDVHGGNDPSNIHVHTRQSAPIPMPDGSVVYPSQQPGGGVGSGLGGDLTLPGGSTVDQLLLASQQNVSVNDQLLQAYLQGNPALAAQIDAAKTPGAGDDQVMSALTSMDSTITDLKAQDAVGNKNTIDALSSTQREIAQGAGFEQSPSALSQAQSAMSAVGGAVSAVFQAAQAGLDALAATQDIADRLVYGVRNTEDINKLVDNFQKYITYAASIFSAAGSIASAAGSFTGGMDMGGTSAAGGILSLVASALEGVNMAIDFGQQVYHIVGSYVGRFLSQLTAGLNGTPLMGNVRFLLNKNTGQLISYSEDNPGNKNYSDVPAWMNQTYDYGGGANPNPQMNTQWNIYAGPGQSPGEMLNEVVWMYQTQGTSGALAPANF